ncbi:MAG: ATP-binding sensor histidine kinase [Cyanobacteriota bacterium]|nr:ATP-binding sensor histidine kinase [Cyanobacteriota bacterium]
MLDITGYQILKQIYSGSRTKVYRGVREEDKTPVILKILQNEYPTPAELGKLKQEYQILENIDLLGIIKAYTIEKYRNSFALILEDLGGQSLAEYLTENTLSISEFLSLAIKLADTLGQLHQKQIIHQDIKPPNIIINPITCQIKITDFSMATTLKSLERAFGKIKQLEGTIAYMSPEQTGRMNRSVDYRTDFYSLGVTFYQMLTGKLPFESQDAMELVHCHLAKQPQFPQQIKAEIPAILGGIVMKLLAKNAEDRYQSGFGLKADLETCQQQLENTGTIEEFILGIRDVSSQLQIPQKLYGREEELARLLAAFERVCSGGIEIVLVGGYSGVGKSALVGETQKPLVQYRGYFVSGKFDQLKRNIPYAAIIEAFSDLMGQILAESEENILFWKEKVLEALGINAQVIIDVIPELESIVGKQPSVPELGPTEAQNRFNLVFKKFAIALSQKDHPLVIFLDDLQWADSASLKLMELLAGDSEIECLLLIGAYRDNEVDATHPLMLTVGEMEKAGTKINSLILENLGLEDVKRLISDTFKCLSYEGESLAELLLAKTNGNPFFITQLIESLFEEQLLIFDGSIGSWGWEIEEITKVGITDNVVDLMVGKIHKLPSSTRDILKLAACIGNRFDLEMLAVVGEKSIPLTSSLLWEALEPGLIVSKSHAWLAGEYQFLHDRVQQAAYSSIAEEEKKVTHLKIGRLLLENTPPEELDENIFEIVNQLNYGVESIDSESEKVNLAQLNLRAGKKARASAAYDTALNYFNVAMELLESDRWESNYELVRDIYLGATEAEYLNSNFQRCHQLAEVALTKLKTLLEKVNIWDIIINSYLAISHMQEAIELGLKVVEMLGVSLEKDAPKIEVKIEYLANLPQMIDANKLAVLRILYAISSAVFVTNPELILPVNFTQVNLCTNYGNSAVASKVYVFYGATLCAFMDDISLGYQFGKLALQFLEERHVREFQSVIFHTFGAGIQHWKEPIKATLKTLQKAFFCGLETGELIYSGYAIMAYCSNLFSTGERLETVEQKQREYLEKMQKLKLEYNVNYGAVGRQLTLNLLNRAPDKLQLIGEAFNESETLPILIQYNIGTTLFYAYLAKVMLAYIFLEPERAIASAKEGAKYEQSAAGFLTTAEYNFYYSLALLASYPTVPEEKQKEYFKIVEVNQERMKNWARHAPFNFQNKYDLVAAETSRVLGEHLTAMELYDKAIAGAKENGYIQEAAIAYERAAEFYQTLGRIEIAQLYMKNALNCYARWGAIAKVEQLESKYPYLKTPTSSGTIHATASASSSGGTANILDVATVIKASQTLAGEIKLEKLLEKLMKIAIENAGAQTGFLILKREENWLVRASATAEEVTITDSLPLNSENLPLSSAVVNYVIRTQENLVLNDATNQGQFTRDAYILASKPKSILCAPLVHQNQLTGILYLENNLATGAFTPERLEVLKLLSSQIAISLENAELYSDLREFNQNLEQLASDRTLELTQTLENLKATQNQLVESEKMAALGGLVAGVAHEINTPLGLGVTAASLLADKITDFVEIYKCGQMKRSDLEHFLNNIMQNSTMILSNLNRAGDLIASFKQVAVDQTSEAQRRFKINQYLEETLLSLRSSLKKTNHQIEINGDADLEVNSYPGAFSQIVTNLVMNSLVHAYHNLDRGKLTFNFFREGETIIFEYADDGVGIAPENVRKIFEPFFTTKRNQGGSGLGLHIVYNFVTQKLQGTIECESQLGRGTKFLIKFPMDVRE